MKAYHYLLWLFRGLISKGENTHFGEQGEHELTSRE